MGMFDTINAGGKSYQTKALGKGLSTYHVGDSVKVWRAPFTQEEYIEALVKGLESFSEDCQVECLGDESALFTVRNGRIAEVDVKRDRSLPLFDYYGRPTDHKD